MGSFSSPWTTKLFAAQSADYKNEGQPGEVTARVVIEAGVTDAWWLYAGANGRVIGLDRFGESAPAGELFKHFGFSVENVLKIARETLAG